jgi:hypothetical protein
MFMLELADGLAATAGLLPALAPGLAEGLLPELAFVPFPESAS